MLWRISLGTLDRSHLHQASTLNSMLHAAISNPTTPSVCEEPLPKSPSVATAADQRQSDEMRLEVSFNAELGAFLRCTSRKTLPGHYALSAEDIAALSKRMARLAMIRLREPTPSSCKE